jgi:periplasmic copper chaperone A
MKRHWLSFFVFACLTALIVTGCTPARELRVSEAWARPGFTGGSSAVYLIIDNPNVENESLLNAGSPIAEFVELHHSMQDQSGMMVMEEQESIDVPGQSRVTLEPGGFHIMLIRLVQDLNPGDTIPVTLYFQNSGELEIMAEVREP